MSEYNFTALYEGNTSVVSYSHHCIVHGCDNNNDWFLKYINPFDTNFKGNNNFGKIIYLNRVSHGDLNNMI